MTKALLEQIEKKLAELDPEAMSFDHEEAEQCKAALFRIVDKSLSLCSQIDGAPPRVNEGSDTFAAKENARFALLEGKAAALRAMFRPKHRPSEAPHYTIEGGGKKVVDRTSDEVVITKPRRVISVGEDNPE